MCCSKKIAGFLFVLAVLTELGLLWWMRAAAPTGLLGWVETHNAAEYYGPNAPDPPYDLGMDDRRLLADRVAQAHALSGVTDDFGRIVALREWTRDACPEISLYPHTNDPSDILEAFDRGDGGACGALGALYCATLLAHGHRARLVQLIRDPLDVPHWKKGPLDTHITVEVFSLEHGKWFASDPTFNCWFRHPDDQTPLSARELQLIAADPQASFSITGWVPLARAGVVVTEYDGENTEPRVETYYIDPVLLFGNIFLLYYDVYGSPPDDPIQKYTRLISAHVLGTEKVVWLLPPGQAPSHIVLFHTAANWIPLIALLLLILLLVPGGRPRLEEYEDEEEEE